MRGPKASVRSQGGDIRQWMGSGDGSSGGVASSSSAAPALRQVDLTQLAGVVAWDGASSLLEGIPPTLYLGEREVSQLKERLLDASARESPDDHLVLLRRLSTMVTSAPPAPPPRPPSAVCAERAAPPAPPAAVHACPACPLVPPPRPPSAMCAERAAPPAPPAAVHASTPGGDPDWRDCRKAQEVN